MLSEKKPSERLEPESSGTYWSGIESVLNEHHAAIRELQQWRESLATAGGGSVSEAARREESGGAMEMAQVELTRWSSLDCRLRDVFRGIISALESERAKHAEELACEERVRRLNWEKVLKGEDALAAEQRAHGEARRERDIARDVHVNLRVHLDEAEKRYRFAEAQLTDVAEALRQTEAEYKSTREALRDARMQASAQSTELSGVRSDLAARDATIGGLQAQLTGARNSMRDAERRRLDATTESADLREKLAEVETENERLSALFQQTHGVHHSWVAKAQEVDGLREKLRQAEELHGTYEQKLSRLEQQYTVARAESASLTEQLRSRLDEHTRHLLVMNEIGAIIGASSGTPWERLPELLRSNVASMTERLATVERERDQALDCRQDVVCAVPPGCQRHWEERNRELVRERDELRDARDSLDRAVIRYREEQTTLRTQLAARSSEGLRESVEAYAAQCEREGDGNVSRRLVAAVLRKALAGKKFLPGVARLQPVIQRDESTPEKKAFWDHARECAAEAETWPESRRALTCAGDDEILTEEELTKAERIRQVMLDAAEKAIAAHPAENSSPILCSACGDDTAMSEDTVLHIRGRRLTVRGWLALADAKGFPAENPPPPAGELTVQEVRLRQVRMLEMENADLRARTEKAADGLDEAFCMHGSMDHYDGTFVGREVGKALRLLRGIDAPSDAPEQAENGGANG